MLEAIELTPAFAEAHNNLANQYLRLGQFCEAAHHYRLALKHQPLFDQARSNLLLLSLYSGDEEVRAEALAGFDRSRLSRSPPPPAIFKFEKRRKRLRIGYVSADFHAYNPVPKFMIPLLTAHDRRRFEVIGYSNSSIADDVTGRVMAACDHWREIRSMDDEKAAARIRHDHIDILVDLSGHWSGNRLGVFALRPAPLQISYLGYPDDTGLPEIRYRITDKWADPEGQPCEHLLRLPCSYFCFEPPKEAPPPSVQSPSSRTESFTFGSFNYRPKITPAVVSAWSAILSRVPGSRLLLHRHDMDPADVRESLTSAFEAQGISRFRVVFEDGRTKPRDHLALYHEVDLALDTFPYNGATTTCEALFMGVPVLTTLGNRHVSRVGASLLAGVGLDELVAGSAEEYVGKAVGLARDIEGLARIRKGLRQRMQRSTLMQPKRFAREFEAALTSAWAASALKR